MKLIAELNTFFNFDHNIFLFDSTDHMNRFINAEGTIMQPPQSLYVLTSAFDNINPVESLKEAVGKNAFMIVVPLDYNLDQIFYSFHRLAQLQRLNIDLKIGFFFNRFIEVEDLRELFQNCKKHLLANVFATAYAYPTGISTLHGSTLNIFTFNPFGNLDVINVTASKTYDNLFSSIKSNFQQHELRIGRPYGLLMDELLWPNVFGLMNATFTLVKVNSSLGLFPNSTDITLTEYSRDDSGVRYVYPGTMEHQLIIVPEALPYPEFSAYLRTFISEKILSYSLIVIAVVILLLTVSRYFKDKSISFVESVLNVGNLLMNDNQNIKYQKLSHAEIFLVVPLTFIGFVITNGILSNLKSHLTRPVLQPQIKTLEDIHNSQLQIFTLGEGLKKKLLDVLTNQSKHTDWNERVIALERDEFGKRISYFNTSASFFVHNEYAKMVLGAQEHLGVKGFLDPKIFISTFFYTYAVNETFVFIDRLDEIIHWTRSAGLFNLWWRQSHNILQQKLVNTNLERLEYLNGTPVQTFEFPMFIVYGWISSVLVLIIEIIWNKMCNPRAARKE